MTPQFRVAAKDDFAESILVISPQRDRWPFLNEAAAELGLSLVWSETLEQALRYYGGRSSEGCSDASTDVIQGVACTIIHFRDANCCTALVQLTAKSHWPVVLALTDHQTPGNVTSILRCGAWDVLSSPLEIKELLRSLGPAIAEGRRRLKDRRLIADFQHRLEHLSHEEREVFESICEGKLNKQMARDFDVSVRTVEQRRRRVFLKMDVESAVPLARLAATVRTLNRPVSHPHFSSHQARAKETPHHRSERPTP